MQKGTWSANKLQLIILSDKTPELVFFDLLLFHVTGVKYIYELK
jgi:hypothetical protein